MKGQETEQSHKYNIEWKKADIKDHILAVAGMAWLVGVSSCPPEGWGFSD